MKKFIAVILTVCMLSSINFCVYADFGSYPKFCDYTGYVNYVFPKSVIDGAFSGGSVTRGEVIQAIMNYLEPYVFSEYKDEDADTYEYDVHQSEIRDETGIGYLYQDIEDGTLKCKYVVEAAKLGIVNGEMRNGLCYMDYNEDIIWCDLLVMIGRMLGNNSSLLDRTNCIQIAEQYGLINHASMPTVLLSDDDLYDNVSYDDFTFVMYEALHVSEVGYSDGADGLVKYYPYDVFVRNSAYNEIEKNKEKKQISSTDGVMLAAAKSIVEENYSDMITQSTRYVLREWDDCYLVYVCFDASIDSSDDDIIEKADITIKLGNIYCEFETTETEQN